MPRVKMTRLSKAVLYVLRVYLIFLLVLIFIRFIFLRHG
jgi:hypothetical protein